MKKLMLSIGSTLAVIIAILYWQSLPCKAGPSRTSTPAVVVLEANEYWQNGFPIGLVIETCSCSSNAPQFKRGDDLSEALAVLREQGFQITIHAYGWLTYTAIR